MRSTLALAAALLWLGAAGAATVPDLYAARVPLSGNGSVALDDAFGRALAEVLVKVTGQRNLRLDPAVRGVLANPGALVKQFQPGPGGLLRVQFDAPALRGRLDAASLPIWAEDRPTILVWLVTDPGAGTPRLLTDAGPVPGTAPVAADPMDTLRNLLLATAAARGLVAVLPPADSAVVPGPDSPDAAVTAARRAGAELVLLGRGLATGGSGLQRWSLLLGDEPGEWQGDVSDGLHGVADRLARRYATAASAGRQLRLLVTGVDSFERYGQLQRYLRTVGVIRNAVVERVGPDGILLALNVRGDASRLRDAFALGRVLGPGADEATGPALADGGGAAPDLTYRLVPAP